MAEELSFAQKLEHAKLPEGSEDICLRGDLVAEYNALHQQLAAIPTPPPGEGSLAGDPRKAQLEHQIKAVRERMRAGTQTFKLRALGKRAYREFLDDHPPRPEDRRDMLVGYNRETMGPALIQACVFDPVVTAEQWETLGDVMSTGEWAKLDKLATDLNFSEVNIPF